MLTHFPDITTIYPLAPLKSTHSISSDMPPTHWYSDQIPIHPIIVLGLNMSRSVVNPISTHPIIFPGSNVRWKQVSTKNPPTPPSYPILTLPKCVSNVKCKSTSPRNWKISRYYFRWSITGEWKDVSRKCKIIIGIQTYCPARPDLNHTYRVLTHWTCL